MSVTDYDDISHHLLFVLIAFETRKKLIDFKLWFGSFSHP